MSSFQCSLIDAIEKMKKENTLLRLSSMLSGAEDADCCPSALGLFASYYIADNETGACMNSGLMCTLCWEEALTTKYIETGL